MQYRNRQTLSREEKAERQRLAEIKDAERRLKNNRLGITVFQGSWVMVFIALIWVNTQMRFSSAWLAEGGTLPDAVLPTAATVTLLISAILARQALKSVLASQTKAFLQSWMLAIGLGAVFLVIMMTQFFAISPEMGQFVSVYRLMIGYHALHALVIGYMMIQVYRYGQVGKYHAENFWSVEATVKLWYFVVIAWIMFYVVLYLV